MLIWSLLVAKAKVGFAASSSKDSDAVQSSWKRVVKILLVVGIMSVAQLKLDPSSPKVNPTSGRMLQATEATLRSNENAYSFQDLLQ
jgi:hypothetical protein